jgi:hypothetical protein
MLSSKRKHSLVNLEQEREHPRPRSASEVQKEVIPDASFPDHDTSLNQVLNEALRIHSGPAWRVFQVGGFSLGFVVSSLAFFRVRAFSDPVFIPLTRRWKDVERRGRERYDALDRLDADLNWYRGQYNALDALIEALRSPDRWLVYGAEALLDHPPGQDAQGTGDVSAVEKVMTALVKREDALRRAREDLAGHVPLRRRGRSRSPLLAPSSNRTARPSRGRRPGRVRPRRRPRRPRGLGRPW